MQAAATLTISSEGDPKVLSSPKEALSSESRAASASAMIGSAAFKSLYSSAGLTATMLACAGVSVAGLVLTFFFVEDKRGANMEGESEDTTTQADQRRENPENQR